MKNEEGKRNFRLRPSSFFILPSSFIRAGVIQGVCMGVSAGVQGVNQAHAVELEAAFHAQADVFLLAKGFVQAENFFAIGAGDAVHAVAGTGEAVPATAWTAS